MKKYFYIFRHGETDWNKEKRCQGWIDVPLNDTGVKQANKLADVMSSINLDIIYSSPLSRAFETAKIVAKPNNTKILTHYDLRECNSGVLGGKIVRITSNPYDIQMDFSKEIIVMPANFMHAPDFVPENGESRNEAMARMIAAIISIAKTSNDQNIGISTHGEVARSVIAKFTEFDLPVGGMPNATYFRLDWDGENLSLNELPEWLKSNQAPKGGE